MADKQRLYSQPSDESLAIMDYARNKALNSMGDAKTDEDRRAIVEQVQRINASMFKPIPKDEKWYEFLSKGSRDYWPKKASGGLARMKDGGDPRKSQRHVNKEIGEGGLEAVRRFLSELPGAAREWPRQLYETARMPADLVLGGSPEQKALDRQWSGEGIKPLASESYGGRKPGSPEYRARQVAEFANPLINAALAPKQAMALAGSPVGQATLGGLAAMLTGVGDIAAPAAGGMAGVIKQGGGNWDGRSVEDALRGLKRDTPVDWARVDTDAAGNVTELGRLQAKEQSPINSWLDKRLDPYVRNLMATPEDPLRLMADRFPAEKRGALAQLNKQREAAIAKRDAEMAARGVPMEYLTRSNEGIRDLETRIAEWEARKGLHANIGLQPGAAYIKGRTPTGESELAKNWDALADQIPRQASYLDHAPTGDISPEALRHLGGQFAVDNPMAQAYAFNRGKSTRDLGFDHLIDELTNALNPESGLPKHLLINPKDLPKKSVEQMSEHVDKIDAWRAVQKRDADRLLATNPATFLHKAYEGDPRGMRWVQLKKGDETPEEALAAALKYEGDTMNHCVGGYCPDVLEGRSRIMSLRDDAGQPHATVEIMPEARKEIDKWNVREALTPEETGVYFEAGRTGSHSSIADQLKAVGLYDTIAERLGHNKPLGQRINQIKGHYNKAPAEDVQSYIQDFVRSGKWSDVGDLQNTGLQRLDRNIFGDSELGDYATQEMIDAWRAKTPGMASGGTVTAPRAPWDIFGL